MTDESNEPREHHVVWRMDIEAPSAEDAARKALAIHRDPESIATTFEVDGESVHLYEIERPFAEAREMGRAAGRAAGSWAADGNTSAEHVRMVLKMFADFDPALDDYLPREPNLSGEFADDPTPQTIAVDILGDGYEPESCDALADAWQEGVSETFYAECERVLRAFLPADDDGPQGGESA